MLRVQQIDFYRLQMTTRFPFRYGIATLSELPHLVVRAEVEIDEHRTIGLSADGLAPKWFTKDPTTDYASQDLPQMLRSIQVAARLATQLPVQRDFFHWWQAFQHDLHGWATVESIPPLLASFAGSLIERTVLEAFCRRHETPLSKALRQNIFKFDLGQIRPDLSGIRPRDVLPDRPLSSVVVRHTVGISDPFTEGEIDSNERIDDGLPHSLVAAIERYGLTHMKVKLSGDARNNRDRMIELAKLLKQQIGSELRFSLDANEQFSSMDEFREQWLLLQSEPLLCDLFTNALLFVEQPVHREQALSDSTGDSLDRWPDHPPMIIDESDAELESLPRALQIGYSGTSHKNCKGIVKSLLAAATIQRNKDSALPRILSAEDLANVGPIALHQDLAVVAALGISHVERNGHHYFAGLKAFSPEVQQQVLRDHPDLYGWSTHGFAHVIPRDGRLSLASINAAPLGVARPIDLQEFEHWDLSAF